MTTLLGHLAARWAVETFFGDVKDVLSLDQYQLLTTTAIVRFWALAPATYTLREEEQPPPQERGRPAAWTTCGPTTASLLACAKEVAVEV